MSTGTQDRVQVRLGGRVVALTASQAEKLKAFQSHIRETCRLWEEEFEPYHPDPEDGLKKVANPEPLPRVLMEALDLPEDFYANPDNMAIRVDRIVFME